MKYKTKDRYATGWSDPRGIFISPPLKDRIEYKTGMTNWFPPRYGVFKYVNGALSETVVDGVSQDAAQGYIKLLKEE
jgi:hypothetical protein